MPDDNPAAGDGPEMPDMLRMMDVASALRRQKEVVDQQLNLEDTKRNLRQRLQAAAEATGERLTTREIDTAIDSYYDSLHSFQEPRFSFSVLMAHLYVRRVGLGVAAAFALALGLLLWWLLSSA